MLIAFFPIPHSQFSKIGKLKGSFKVDLQPIFFVKDTLTNSPSLPPAFLELHRQALCPTLPFSIASLIIAYTSINKVSSLLSPTLSPMPAPIPFFYFWPFLKKIADSKKGVVISVFPCYNIIYQGSFAPTLDFFFNAWAHKQKNFFE